jgi:hypothetical protein
MGFTGYGKRAVSEKIGGKSSSEAKASVDSVGFMRGLKPPPPSASCSLYRNTIKYRIRHGICMKMRLPARLYI